MGTHRHGLSTDDWQQRELRFPFPEQRTYDRIRPVVLFGQSARARADEPGTPARTLYRQGAPVERDGMERLFPPDASPQPHALPPDIKHCMLDLKADYPPLRVHEIGTIWYVRFNRRPDARTITRLVDATPPSPAPVRRSPRYHEIADHAYRRAIIVRLHSAGWTKQRIAGYVETSRQTVHDTLRRWIEAGIGGL